MNLPMRRLWNKVFASVSGLSVILMAAALVVLLGPIFYRGSKAVFFDATYEFRKLEMKMFQRGDVADLETERRQIEQARRPVYDLMAEFREWADPDFLSDRARSAYRQCKQQLSNRQDAGTITEERYDTLRRGAKTIRDALEEAYTAPDTATADNILQPLLEMDRTPYAGTWGQTLLEYADQFRSALRENPDLANRKQYRQAFEELKPIIKELFGPLPGEPEAQLAQAQYGATRWDQARQRRDRALWATAWVETEPGQPLQPRKKSRAELFAGTKFAPLFPLLENDLESMLHPRFKFYWRYFTDFGTPGNLFGGVGKEVVGTLLLALLAMLIAMPLGVIAAAYLVECTREGLVVRVIRTCINTLAGVPSVVFGLFGLALFITAWPKFWETYTGLCWFLPTHPCVFYGAMTLAVLVLPIMIRASEEAIKAVPRSYKEASLSLGAGGFRTFVTVTLPAALPGILTGIILSISRAAGETAPIMFTAAASYMADWPGNLFEKTPTLSYSAYVFATGDNLAAEAPHNQYGIIMALILLVLLLNVAAILLRSRVSKKLRGR
jgi:phosphate transport system permease protein